MTTYTIQVSAPNIDIASRFSAFCDWIDSGRFDSSVFLNEALEGQISGKAMKEIASHFGLEKQFPVLLGIVIKMYFEKRRQNDGR